jgi:class 3 adenylate cyclase/predicted ATPase
MDIVVWLRSLGLGKYEAAFRENEIDETVLPDLTADDLKELGVTALGHRRKLLAAIAALRDDASGKASSVDTATSSSAPSAPPEDRAERRQVTVMFSDLVGSTALSARMDPEDLREVISGYQKCVADTVGRFGGFVAKYMGDGVLIYFGYPQAHEDDAERAVRAGLELVAKTLQTRVGIATGLVVVGDLIGSGSSQEQAIVGETPNLAARLQGVAEPNGVVIAESTRKLLGHLLDLDDLGARDLKGISGPVRAWAALRPASVESRFEAFHAGGLTELVGREEELELLLRRWSKAKGGQGQVVLLFGEPGIGKSRLTAALLERLAVEPHTRLRYFCSPQHTDSALYPIISQMERAAGFAHDDRAQAKLDKLDALLAQSFTPPEDAALFVEMLSLPNNGRYPIVELTPQRRRHKTMEALTAQLEALSRSNPVLMIFEDAHWMDPTSLEVLGRTVDRLKTLSVLLTITHRPEFEPPWVGRPYVTALSLNRLGEREIAAMIDRVTGNKALPEGTRKDIIERTDGIPLFVEEMTKAVLEAEDAGAPENASPSIGVPASLHASLMARLDRLGPAKEVAQIGAAVGREFSHPLLQAVVRKPDAELQSALDRLVTAGLLFRQGAPPHATYLFKHALVQDAAYGTLVRETRRGLHARIAETLEDKFSEIAENQPELLARHYNQAGLIEKAASLWGKAGQRSLERSALVEAVAQLSRALDQSATLPASTALRREQIKLQIALTNALMHTKGYTASETKASLDQARSLIEQADGLGERLEDPLLPFSALFAVWVNSAVAFEAGTTLGHANHLLALAEELGETAPLVIAHRAMGQTSAFSGALVAARAHLDKGVALYDPTEHRPLATRFGQDPIETILSARAWALIALGFPDAAVADARQALKGARAINHAATLMHALFFSSFTHVCCKDYATASALIDELAVLTEKKSAFFWKAGAMLNQGYLFAVTGKAADAVRMTTSGLKAWRSTGANLWVPIFLSSLARANADLKKFDDAWRSIGEAMTTVETTKERWFEAEVHRIAGEVALMSPEQDATKAQAYFDCALTVARAQQAKSWELRAAMSLARLWRDQGKVQQARELLAPVYGWFTEGFDTHDLKEAKALLGTLAL